MTPLYTSLHTRWLAVAAASCLLAAPAHAAEQTVTLSIPAMSCATCPITIKQALTRLDGVRAVRSDLRTRQTTVTYDDAKLSPAALMRATTEVGFPATVAAGRS